jgi:hypothetical protein
MLILTKNKTFIFFAISLFPVVDVLKYESHSPEYFQKD